MQEHMQCVCSANTCQQVCKDGWYATAKVDISLLI